MSGFGLDGRITPALAFSNSGPPRRLGPPPPDPDPDLGPVAELAAELAGRADVFSVDEGVRVVVVMRGDGPAQPVILAESAEHARTLLEGLDRS